MAPKEEKMIVVMGPTGAGKSSSIQDLVPLPLRSETRIGHDLESETKAVQAVHLDNKADTRVKLIDTPRFDNSRADVTEIAQKNKALEETSAGTEVRNGLLARLKEHEGKIESLKDELGAVPQNIETERQILNGIAAKLSEQFEELGRGIPGQIGIDPPLRFEPSINFPVPDTKSVIQCVKLLQLVKMYESALASSYPKFSSLVATRTTRFASAVEESVKDVRRGLSILRSALSSESVHTLQQFMKADPHPRSFTRGAWTKARDGMEFVANETGIMLSKLPKPGVADKVWNGKTVKRFDGLTEISESAKVVVVEMETMINWWTPVIDALENVEDAAQRMKGCIGLNDSTVKVTLSRIIRALDSYCEAYARCTEDIRKAALELDSRSPNIPLR